MDSTQAAQILAMLHGAYPWAEIDDATARVWAHSLGAADYDRAVSAVERWIGSQNRFPTVADLNGAMREEAIAERDFGPGPDRQLPGSRSIRCDGSGWFDRGRGMEPCPHCNPWMRTLWENGEIHEWRKRPPSNWIQPQSCFRFRTIEDGEPASWESARAAMARGIREHLAEIGFEGDVEAKVEERLRGAQARALLRAVKPRPNLRFDGSAQPSAIMRDQPAGGGIDEAVPAGGVATASDLDGLFDGGAGVEFSDLYGPLEGAVFDHVPEGEQGLPWSGELPDDGLG